MERREVIMMITQWRMWRWIANIMRLGTLFWLIGHFILTVAYVMPINPIKIVLQPLLDVTIGTYFQQNWSLFAPNPVSSDHTLLVHFLTQAEAIASEEEGLPIDGWYDVSTPFWARYQKNRFSAYDRLIRPQANAVMTYLRGSPKLEPWAHSCQKGDSASCTFYNEQLQITRQKAGEFLARIGSAFCNSIRRCGPDIKYVALRDRETLEIPWSERYTAKRIVQDIELGIYPINRMVVTMPLYTEGNLK